MTPPAFRLVLAQALDAFTFAGFYLVIGAGVHAERNPLVTALLAMGGVQFVVLIKVGIAAFVGWRHDHTRRPLSARYVRLRTVAVAVAAASGIVGAGFNLAAIVAGLRT